MTPATKNMVSSTDERGEYGFRNLGGPLRPAQTELVCLLAQIAVDHFLEECSVEDDSPAVPCNDREDQ